MKVIFNFQKLSDTIESSVFNSRMCGLKRYPNSVAGPQRFLTHRGPLPGSPLLAAFQDLPFSHSFPPNGSASVFTADPPCPPDLSALGHVGP